MNNSLKISLVLCLISAFSLSNLNAQYTYDTTRTMNRKNIVRFNPTPSLIVGLQSTVFGYERVIKPHQSVSLNVGRLKMNQLIDLGLDKYGINTDRSSGGYSIALDYRRYIKKRNRGFAPDGLYWGPFLTYYQYHHDIAFSYTDPLSLVKTNAEFTSKLEVFHVGVELGYQFIIAKRLAVDLILIGPSWGKYKGEFGISGNLDIDEKNEYFQSFYNYLIDRFPGMTRLLEEKSLSKDGNFGTNTFGMRYLIQVGFLF